LFLGLINGQQTSFAGGSRFQSMTLDIIANGDELVDTTFRSLLAAESFFRDDALNLGSSLGPSIDLTVAYSLTANGPGGFGFDFAAGGAVPETSTWAAWLRGARRSRLSRVTEESRRVESAVRLPKRLVADPSRHGILKRAANEMAAKVVRWLCATRAAS